MVVTDYDGMRGVLLGLDLNVEQQLPVGLAGNC